LRYGLVLLSMGIIILLLGEVVFPFNPTVRVKDQFTMPPWFKSATVNVVHGKYQIKSEGLEENLSQGAVACFTNFTMNGNGTALVTLHGLTLFYGKDFMDVSISLMIVGILVEVSREAINRMRK